MSVQYKTKSSISESDPLLANQSLEGGLQSSLTTDQYGTKDVPTNTPKVIKGSSWYGASLLLVNAALGAGLLNFPEVFGRAGGIVVATCVQAVLLAFMLTSLLALAYCSDVIGSCTYQEVIRSICGERTRRVCAVCIVFYTFGSSVTYLIVIGDQFDTVLRSLYGMDVCNNWYMRRELTTIVSAICIILPLSFPKRINFLQYASSFGVVALLYVVFLIIYEYFAGNYTPGPVKTSPTVWTDIFLVIPTICFGYECHVSSVPIYSCLADRRVVNFLRTVLVAIALCAFTYSVAAAAGYLTFGSYATSDILESYDAKDTVVMVGTAALGAKMFTNYPMVMFCGRTAIDDLYIETRGISRDEAVKDERCRRIIIVIIWFSSSLTLALVIPNIGILIEFVGSLAAIFIFVFPGLCLLKVTLKKNPDLAGFKDKFLVLWSTFFLTIGTFIFFLVLTQALIKDISGKSIAGKPNPCR
ncbi:putative sodium-coupled neutral amino acid transporter 7 [Limulus polyphemus]|uniref:Sodium-coupled neutral amino acid transporter 7 n=1 Tax=Limulus polyphemus TaxID=6850 RepID=A0ABM1S435_LIMPO|nr:putative sodium-coupled neutral amino acid transporter 7 [Limulus polyphemus]